MGATDPDCMREALEQAQRAEELGEVPIGAVVVHGSQVIGRGYNRKETDQDPTAHAEILALKEAAANLGRWRLFGCTVYVTLEPCPMCAGALVQSRVERLVYGAPDPKSGAIDTLYRLGRDERLNHCFAVTAGVLEAQCAGQLRGFFERLRSADKG